jgi:hypothetical protein
MLTRSSPEVFRSASAIFAATAFKPSSDKYFFRKIRILPFCFSI